MTVNMSILYSNSTQPKVYYSNTRPQFCMNRALFSFRAILHLRKIPNVAKNWCVFSQYAPNEILLICQILNSSRTKIFYGNVRHKFYMKTPSLLKLEFAEGKLYFSSVSYLQLMKQHMNVCKALYCVKWVEEVDTISLDLKKRKDLPAIWVNQPITINSKFNCQHPLQQKNWKLHQKQRLHWKQRQTD